MWVFWVLVSLVVAVWGTLSWVGVLRTKFQHTRESRLCLLSVGLLGIALGWQTARMFGPGWSVKVHLAAAVVLGVIYFDVLSMVLVAIWRAILTLDMDEAVSRLEEEEARIWRSLNAVRYGRLQDSVTGISGDAYPVTHAEGPAGPEDEVARLREVVSRWVETGGMTRVRALKVESWKEEYGKMPLEELMRERERLTEDAPADPVLGEQTQVRKALVEIELISRKDRVPRSATGTRPGTAASGTGAPSPDSRIRESEEELRRRLEEVSRELARVRAEKERFLRGKIRLSWREQDESRKLL